MTHSSGEHLGERLKGDRTGRHSIRVKLLGLSANVLAQRLGVTAARVNEIANERRGITADTALRLGRRLSTTPEFWMNLRQRLSWRSPAGRSA